MHKTDDVTSSGSYPAAVFARLSSRRLPRKALLRIEGDCLIDFVIKTLQATSSVSEVVLATSTDESDDELTEHVRGLGLRVIRGDLVDASNRLCKVMKELGTRAVFRVNGDSPFVSRCLLNRAAAEFEAKELDLVTNVFPRTYPPGVSVELINSKTYTSQQPLIKTSHDREHITTFLYANSEKFRILNLTADSNEYRNLHLAVDSEQDFEIANRMIQRMRKPHYEYTMSELSILYTEAVHVW